ncbi:MAG TPA: hypothetical protein PLC54_06995 [Spirochaetales bacterium]|nr:hypothetical protein [Spirochaetales bacterium]
MSPMSVDALVAKGKAGTLNPGDQSALASECEIYRNMALRLERCVHDLCKIIEEETR